MRRIPSSGQKFSCVNSPVKKPSVFNSLFARPLVLDIGYDIKNIQKSYRGADAKTAHLPKGTSFASLPPASALGHPWPSDVHIDHYGRTVPKPAHGSVNLDEYTSSSKLILDAIVDLYERITQPDLLVRRVTVTANHVISEKDVPKPEDKGEQLDLFTDYIAITAERERADNEERKEKSLQHAMIAIKHKFGKNAILKGSNLQARGMTIEQNQQIGGHKA